MRIRGRIRPEAIIPQTSTADIAFLLLIFFIATTVFDTETGIPLVLPGTLARPIQIEARNVARLTADAAGNILLDGRPVVATEIHGFLQQRLAANPNLVISIETEAEAKYEVMIVMLDEVKKARAERISLRLRRS